MASLTHLIRRALFIAFSVILLSEIGQEYAKAKRLERQRDFARIIDTSGRVQALSQRIAFLVLSDLSTSDPALKVEVERQVGVALEDFDRGARFLIDSVAGRKEWDGALDHLFRGAPFRLTETLNAVSEGARELSLNPGEGTRDGRLLGALGRNAADVYHGLEVLSGLMTARAESSMASFRNLSWLILGANVCLISMTGVFAIFHLSTALQREKEQRAAAEERVNEQLSDVERFAAVVAHDLRSPLSTVFSAGKLLQRRSSVQGDPESLELVSSIVDQTERLSTMISELLSFFKSTAARYSKKRVQLSALMEEVTKLLEAEIASSNARVRCASDVVLYVDPASFRSVLQNLVQNSLRYSGVPAPEIVISGSLAKNGTKDSQVVVEDNGKGIPAELLAKCAEPFTRGPKTSSIRGAGLGLSFVKRIVERHGGMLTISNKTEGGARFVIVVPS